VNIVILQFILAFDALFQTRRTLLGTIAFHLAGMTSRASVLAPPSWTGLERMAMPDQMTL
jgi:hypothetical protein